MDCRNKVEFTVDSKHVTVSTIVAVGMGLQRVVASLNCEPTLFLQFSHGVIPTCYFILNGLYTSIVSLILFPLDVSKDTVLQV